MLRVGVAHQSHGDGAVLFSPPVNDAPGGLHVLQLLLQTGNPPPDVPPVRFQLGFAGASGTDAAAQPGQGRTLSPQPWQQIAQLSKLHLQLALLAAGTLGENVQNQGGAVDHPDLAGFFQVADLGGSQLPVEDQQIHILLLAGLGRLLHHAGANTGGGVRGRPFLGQGEDRLRARGAGQLLQLRQRRLRVILPRVQGNQQRPLGPGFIFIHSLVLP